MGLARRRIGGESAAIGFFLRLLFNSDSRNKSLFSLALSHCRYAPRNRKPFVSFCSRVFLLRRRGCVKAIVNMTMSIILDGKKIVLLYYSRDFLVSNCTGYILCKIRL
jgi:hypothetical protein